MTRPAPWRRSTAKQRRQRRAEWKIRKAYLAANPSPELLKLRMKKRGDDQRAKAQKKVRGALAGEAIRPFSVLQAAKIREHEHDLLRAEVANRLAALTPGERKALTAGQHMILLCFSAEQLRSIGHDFAGK